MEKNINTFPPIFGFSRRFLKLFGILNFDLLNVPTRFKFLSENLFRRPKLKNVRILYRYKYIII